MEVFFPKSHYVLERQGQAASADDAGEDREGACLAAALL